MKKKYIIALLFCVSLSVYSVNTQAQSNSHVKNENTSLYMQDYKVIIYPNPVTDNKFFVKSELTIKSVEVLNVIGQTIKKVLNTTNLPYNIAVNLPNCDNGMYMVKITFKTKKVIIKKILVK